jgi:hypothetical protein
MLLYMVGMFCRTMTAAGDSGAIGHDAGMEMPKQRSKKLRLSGKLAAAQEGLHLLSMITVST